MRILSSVGMINEITMSQQANKIALSVRTRISVTILANDDQVGVYYDYMSLNFFLTRLECM